MTHCNDMDQGSSARVGPPTAIPAPARHARSTAEGTLRLESGFSLKQTRFDVHEDITVTRSSDGLDWPSLFVALTEEKPHFARQSAVPFIWVSMVLDRADVRRIIGRSEEHLVMEPYRLSIAGPGTPVAAHVDGNLRAVHAFVKDDILVEVAEELFGQEARFADITPAFGFEDLSMSWLLRSAEQALLAPRQNAKLMVEYLSRALAADILGKYAVLRSDRDIADFHRGLNSAQFRRVMEYIDEHIASDISLNELAAAAGLGRTVFLRRFKTSLRQTPHQFVLQSRVRRSQELLVKSALPLSQIALMCGFADQAHFSVVFRRMIGVPPSVFRQKEC